MYKYEEIRPRIFTEEGQRLFIGIRDQVKQKLSISGAVTMRAAITLPAGIGAADGWEMMACIDRMVELEELIELPTTGTAQMRVFVSTRKTA